MARVDSDREFADFVATRSSRLLLVAQHLCGDDDAAEDLTESVLEKVYLKWNRISKSTDPYIYVRRMLVNISTDRQKRHGWSEEAGLFGGDGADLVTTSARHLASEDLALLIDRIALRRALAEFSPRDRAAVVLRYLEDIPELDIAQELGMRLQAVKSVCARALSRLAEFSQHTPEDER